MHRRKVVYLAVRAAAVVVFLVAATLVPRGVPAGMMVVAAGIAAVLSSLWSNAGGPGEQAGARPQERWFDSVRAPQGDWPPFEAPRDATVRPPAR